MRHPHEIDLACRLAAFTRLAQLRQNIGPVLRWDAIEPGFEFEGQRFRYASVPRGIFRPKDMPSDAALSIKTTVPRMEKCLPRRR